MKKIFTFILVLFTVVSFAHNGGISLEKSSTLSTSQKSDGVILPECWENLTQIAYYRWTDADQNPLGWILGTNTYNDAAVAQVFVNNETLSIEGAYFWIAVVGPGTGDIVFSINEIAGGSIGDVIASVSMPLAEVTAYMEEGLTPADFTNSMYVEFENLVEVTSDFALVVDFSAVVYSVHGDGVAIVSNHLTQPCNAGQVFIQDSDGDWSVTTAVNAALTMVAGMFPVAVEPIPGDDFMVTFRVNMAPAVADGFDAAVHNVFVTGTFTGWAEPGTEGSVELTLEAPAKEEHTFYEDFSDFDDFTTDLSPWINIDTHGNGTWGSESFDFPGEASAFGWRVMNPAATDPDITGTHPAHAGGKYLFSVASNPVPDTGEENKWLISPAMKVTADSELSFAAKSITAQYGLERMKVYVSTTGTDPGDFTLISSGAYIEVPVTWTMYTFDLAAYDDETIHFAVENVSNDAFMLFLDAFTVTNLFVDDPVPGDDIFFTVTVEMPGDSIEYKYFSDAIGAGWAGGEWEGGDNRKATITADVTLDDVWALEVSVQNVLAESGLNLYPNPVRNTLYVENASQINEVRIFDLTGRLVMSQVVNNNTASVNVSEFNRGVYIMQVISVNGVASQKFNVIK